MLKRCMILDFSDLDIAHLCLTPHFEERHCFIDQHKKVFLIKFYNFKNLGCAIDHGSSGSKSSNSSRWHAHVPAMWRMLHQLGQDPGWAQGPDHWTNCKGWTGMMLIRMTTITPTIKIIGVVIAQWLARRLATGKVTGSNPGRGENLLIFD